jgi:hydrogenase expression/formation protein HypE
METQGPRGDALSCPLPLAGGELITLAHGAGAGASSELFERLLWPRFANPALAPRHDGAVLALGELRVALATDSFVVRPLEFPGGDIGTLAVHGTLNDLAMCGARPSALSCALLLEEGLERARLERVLDSMARAAAAAGVPIVTGDTKVVERGKGDGLFVNTTGLGLVPPGRDLRPARVAPRDAVLLSRSLGRHGAAVLAARESLGFEPPIQSDTAPLGELVERLLAAAADTHCLRDPTRGGLGAALHEIAAAAAVEIELDEASLPVDEAVRSACELLGLDPLFLACEGCCVAFVPEPCAELALAALRAHPLGRAAARVGHVRGGSARLVLRTALGSRRLVPLPHGEPLPRIC